MASYYLSGYEPPAGVSSASAVKEWQRTLGVTVDGVWGPKTQSAYAAYMSRNGEGTPNWSAGGGAFERYYQSVLSQLTAPSVSVSVPDAQTLRDQWSAVLRPAADAAIKRREDAAEETLAELDADAVSRGMGRSTYVTSVKERELEDAAGDVSRLEAEYGAALAERIYESLEKYEQLRLAAEQYNASAAAESNRAALSAAMNWYQSDVAASAKSAAQSSASSKNGKSKSSTLSVSDYREYLENLTDAQRKQLFGSDSDYWKVRREELRAGLGSELYAEMRRRYGG